MKIFDRAVLWAESPAMAWIMRSWAFLEAIAWFVLPDYLLLLLALLIPGRWRYWFKITWLASAAGSFVMFLLCKWQPAWVGSWLFNIPFTHVGMLERIPDLQWASVLAQPFSGVPAKVWVYGLAAQPGFQALGLLVLMLLARGARMAIVAGVGAWIGTRITPFLRQYWVLLWLAYTMLFFYGLFKTAYL